MGQRSGRKQEGSSKADFQRIYLTHLVTVLRRGRMDQRAASLSARTRAMKLAADLSLAMAARGRTAWRRFIVGKYLSRLMITRCQRRVIYSKGKSQGKRKSVLSAKAKPSKPNDACYNSGRRLPGPDSRPTQTRLFSPDNCDKEAGVAVDSRMQTLKALVPGSGGLDTPIFLKEAADYIVALRMQVQAMQALANFYSD